MDTAFGVDTFQSIFNISNTEPLAPIIIINIIAKRTFNRWRAQIYGYN